MCRETSPSEVMKCKCLNHSLARCVCLLTVGQFQCSPCGSSCYFSLECDFSGSPTQKCSASIDLNICDAISFVLGQTRRVNEKVIISNRTCLMIAPFSIVGEVCFD